MRMAHSQLERLPVRTEGGDDLGKVADVVYDIDTYTIVQLVVTSGILKSHTHRIHPNQIVRISEAEIIVADGIVHDKEPEVSQLTTGVTPAMMREAE